MTFQTLAAAITQVRRTSPWSLHRSRKLGGGSGPLTQGTRNRIATDVQKGPMGLDGTQRLLVPR